MLNFTKLTKDTLPEPNKLIFIKRKGGSIYLGHREDKPISENKDLSRDCYWWANPEHCMLLTERTDLHFRHNFADGTVEGWADLITPNAR